MPSYVTLDRALTRFGARVDRIRQDLYYCDALALSAARRELSYGIEAASYVWLSAATEATVDALVGGLIEEINAARIPLDRLRLSLFAIAEASRHDRLRDVRGLKMWQHRADLHDAIASADECSLSLDQLPIDGRTIRPHHLDTIWRVFGLPGTATVSPVHRLALTDIADARNELAHGGETPKAIAGRKSRQSLLRLVSLVEDILLNMWSMSESYLDQQLYRR